MYIPTRFFSLKPHSPNGAERLTVRNLQSIHIPLFFAEKAILQLKKIQAEKLEESNWRISHHSLVSCCRDGRLQEMTLSFTSILFIWIFGCLLSLLIGYCEATVTQHGREAIYLRMFCKFSSIDARNRWYASVSIRKWRDEGTYAGNNNGLSVWNNLSWDNLSCHLFLCNLDGGVKVLKLLCGVWKEVIF